jgi:hypothetical protein
MNRKHPILASRRAELQFYENHCATCNRAVQTDLLITKTQTADCFQNSFPFLGT